MIVLELHNNIGMGNQFFLYAYVYALSQSENQKIVIFSRMNKPDRRYVLHLFNIDKKEVSKCYRMDKITNRVVWKLLSGIGKYLHLLYKKKFYYYKENKEDYRVYQSIPKGMSNYWITGNFECYRYFDMFRADLIKQFQYIGVITDATQSYLNMIDNDMFSVALHIRGGDFKRLGRNVPIEFYEKAIEYFHKKNSRYTFYLVTEDLEAEKYFKLNPSIKCIKTISSENKDIEDWLCLLHCKNHIVTNSTYSWWAAYLADNKEKKVVTLSKRLYEKLENSKKGYEEFYLPEWIPIDIS